MPCALALAAARATGASLVGIDLLPDGRGRWTVAEINGAVEFTSEYALRPGDDPFAEAAFRLGRAAVCARLRAARAGGSRAPRVARVRPASRLHATPLLDCDAARLRDCSAA